MAESVWCMCRACSFDTSPNWKTFFIFFVSIISVAWMDFRRYILILFIFEFYIFLSQRIMLYMSNIDFIAYKWFLHLILPNHLNNTHLQIWNGCPFVHRSLVFLNHTIRILTASNFMDMTIKFALKFRYLWRRRWKYISLSYI